MRPLNPALYNVDVSCVYHVTSSLKVREGAHGCNIEAMVYPRVCWYLLLTVQW